MKYKSSLTRRRFLQGIGVTLALPTLESFGVAKAPVKRLVAINIPLGFYGPRFFPKTAGNNYETSDYLKPADHLRDRYTVISGTSHPGVDGGHSAEKSFLTAAPHPGSRGFRNTISLDQYIASKVGEATRFASLTVGDESLSWTANGVAIPPQRSPAKLFETLFVSGNQNDVATQRRRLQDGHSILDNVLEEAKAMEGSVGTEDREKLDQFFTAVRETENRLAKSERWLVTPKPAVEAKSPREVASGDVLTWMQSHFEVIRLALATDSTRVVAMSGANHSLVPPLPGVSMGYHGLSHHGKNPEMIKQLEVIERGTLAAWIGFLESLRDTPDGDGSLLDRTQILLGSNLGNASGHLTTNLPVILAGGGFRHGQHLAFDEKDNHPFATLFVSMMQELDLEVSEFASGKGTMRGLG